MGIRNNTHSVLMGYLLWIFGFTGSHRFYYGKQVTGIIWLCTFGLLGVGWLIDLFLIPSMDRQADAKYVEGPYNYNIAWLLLTFLGFAGAHRFYMGKWATGLMFLVVSVVTISSGFLLAWVLTLPLSLLVGVLWTWDFMNLNGQLKELNLRAITGRS